MSEQAGAADLHFRSLMAAVPVGITVFRGPDFIVEMANRTYLQIVDRTEQEFVGRSLFETLPEVKDAVEPLLTSVLTTGVPYHGYEFPVTLNRYGTSETTYFNFVYQPAMADDGSINGVIVVAYEVTELVNAKHRIAESEKQFRNLVMLSPIAMTIFKGPDFIIDFANRMMYEKIWRRKPADVMGKKLVDAFPELKEQRFPELLADVFRTGRTHHEYEALALVGGDDGMKHFYLDFEYAPLLNPDNTTWGLQVTVYDVTERVEARKRMEQVNTELRTFKFVADNVTDFIGMCNMDGVPFYVNRSGRQLVGISDEDDISKLRLADLFFPEDLHNIVNDFMPAVEKKGAGEIQVRFRHLRTGAAVWMQFSVILLRDLNDVPLGFATVSKNITGQRESINELEQKVQERTRELVDTNRELERSNEDLQQFAHVASHDLKEPVRKIRAFSLRLKDEMAGRLGEKADSYLEKIIQSTNRIYAMIEGVLTYSYTDAADKPMEYVDLRSTIDNIRQDLELPIREKNASLIYRDLPVVWGIPHLLYQLFYNLVNNSLKFSRKGVPLVITIESDAVWIKEQRYIRIIVADNGIGFENEYAEKIFSTFTRLHSKDRYEGTGLGLALCKKIVQFHHGSITASGVPDVGAEFTILLPMKEGLHATAVFAGR